MRTLYFSIGRWDFAFGTRARRAWNDFKKFRTEAGLHFVWGKFSLVIEDGTAEVIPTCRECGSHDIGEVSAGDEGLTVCQDCQTIEGGYTYISARTANERGSL